MPVRPDDVPDFAGALDALVDEYLFYWIPDRPDDVPDFAAALQSLVDEYRYYWETPNAVILAALSGQTSGNTEINTAIAAQVVVITATLGTNTGGASSLVSETPDPPAQGSETTPVVT